MIDATHEEACSLIKTCASVCLLQTMVISTSDIIHTLPDLISSLFLLRLCLDDGRFFVDETTMKSNNLVHLKFNGLVVTEFKFCMTSPILKEDMLIIELPQLLV